MIFQKGVLAVLVVVGLLTSINSCTKSKEPSVQDCATKPRTYNADIKAIMDNYCKTCHQPGGAFSSLPLTTYAEVKNATQNGKVLQSIKHDPSAIAMPQGGQKLSQSTIDMLNCWIINNYPEQ